MKPLGPKEAQSKAAKFCSARERSPHEVSQKLDSWGLNPADIGTIVNELVRHGFIDQQRFANAFCHDKFEFNSWGKIKIRHALGPHQIPGDVVEKAMQRIDDKAYYQKALALAKKKRQQLKGNQEGWVSRQKTMAFLRSRGFEVEVIQRVLSEIES